MLAVLTRAIGPAWVKYAFAFALVLGVWAHGRTFGMRAVQDQWDEQRAVDEAAHQEAIINHIHVRESAVAELREQLRRVRRSKTVVEKVPEYITVASDRACVIPNGFVRVHDASAKAVLPGAPRGDDGAASGIALVTVARTVAENYSECGGVRERLIALQHWARSVTTEIKNE